MNVVLVGYRGTGKSAVARALGLALGWPVVSTDAEVERRAARSIPELVAEAGWDRFRDLEEEVVREAAGRDEHVIDTGGGVVLRPQSVTALRETGRVFWLRSSVDRIVSRISADLHRPPLVPGRTVGEEVAEVLSEREPLYRAAAHHELRSEDESPSEVADAALTVLRSEHLHD